jgi:hypothetical protein
VEFEGAVQAVVMMGACFRQVMQGKERKTTRTTRTIIELCMATRLFKSFHDSDCVLSVKGGIFTVVCISPFQQQLADAMCGLKPHATMKA